MATTATLEAKVAKDESNILNEFRLDTVLLKENRKNLTSLFDISDERGRRNFKSLYEAMYHIPINKGFTHHEAEDIVSLTWEKVFDAGVKYCDHEIDPSMDLGLNSRFKAYIFKILYNTMNDFSRRKKARSNLYATIGSQIKYNKATEIPSATEKLIEKEQSEIVIDVVNCLSPIHRNIILLTYWYGLLQKEISTTMKIPIGTVKSRLYYAMDYIRPMLKNNL